MGWKLFMAGQIPQAIWLMSTFVMGAMFAIIGITIGYMRPRPTVGSTALSASDSEPVQTRWAIQGWRIVYF